MSSTLSFLLLPLAFAADPTKEMSAAIKALDPVVLDNPAEAAQMLANDARSRRDEANRRSSQLWHAIDSRPKWERFRAESLRSLSNAVGFLPVAGRGKVELHVTRRLEGKGFRVENVMFESRPGLVVTANLYRPAQPPQRMPGIVLAHSHHNPKSQSELQEMGICWARQGCAVIVPDLPGHGERRQHPFKAAADYSGSFRPGRQDYYFRYVTGLQLYLAGHNLCGWIATDLSRCVDVLLTLPNIDRTRILLFGSVAGGGDPAAVAAALDERITMAAIFNFGGPQPESTYPLPADAETRFNYAGGGSWESTRNLAFSCRDGFLPWVIVGSIAPRKLIYAHEFSWDRKRDPVWRRLQKIWSWYDLTNLAAANGTGTLTGKGPDASHCNNIGRVHRTSMAPALKHWFGLDPPLSDPSDRRSADELQCVITNAPLKLRPIYELLRDEAAKRERPGQLEDDRVRTEWAKLLDAGYDLPAAKLVSSETIESEDFLEQRLVFEVDSSVKIPAIILRPARTKKSPVVIAVAQDGKAAFLRQRSEEIARLLHAGMAVVLPDLRGTGETRPGDARGRSSSATAIAATELMLGRTLLGLRLGDLRSVLRYVQSQLEFDRERIGIWGDSFAPPNARNANIAVPLDANRQPRMAEPLGGMLALFAGMFEKDVRCISADGGLISFATVFDSPFVNVPFDIVVPSATAVGDLDRVIEALAPRPLYLSGLVDGRNVRVPVQIAETRHRRGAYEKKRDLMHLSADRGKPDQFAAWWRKHLAP